MPQEWENANDNDVVNRWERTRFVRNPKNVYEEKFEKKKKKSVEERRPPECKAGDTDRHRLGPTCHAAIHAQLCNSCTL